MKILSYQIVEHPLEFSSIQDSVPSDESSSQAKPQCFPAIICILCGTLGLKKKPGKCPNLAMALSSDGESFNTRNVQDMVQSDGDSVAYGNLPNNDSNFMSVELPDDDEMDCTIDQSTSFWD